MVRTGALSRVVGVMAGAPRIRERTVLMAGGVRMEGREFLPIGFGVPAAAPLIILSQIGEAPRAAGVIRSR
jgi:hypothetical protein